MRGVVVLPLLVLAACGGSSSSAGGATCIELFTPGNKISDVDEQRGCIDRDGDVLLFAFAYGTYECDTGGQVNYTDLGDGQGVWSEDTGEVFAVVPEPPSSAELETWCA